MSHVVVGERVAGAAPQIAGHLIVGAGHLIEMAGGLFQTGATHMPAIPIIASKSINDLSTPIAAEQWQWQQLNSKFGEGAFTASTIYANGLPSYCQGIDFTFAGTPKEVDFSKGINFSTSKRTHLAYGLDMHYSGPGSEAEHMHESYREQQGREAAERVQNGSNNPRDVDKANEYYRDHSA